MSSFPGLERRILFAAKRIPATGNFTTSSRIANVFRSLGNSVDLVHYAELHIHAINFQDIDLVVVLHAVHGYDLLLECIKYQVIHKRHVESILPAQ
mmetsp:Transcript_16830/g.28119  ORF Transcript_16830/g.28119 Transcript_16830/m.28119 type:complete len:96 (+) Transcript_16830:34-321(+)